MGTMILWWYTLWQFDIASEIGPLIVDLPFLVWGWLSSWQCEITRGYPCVLVVWFGGLEHQFYFPIYWECHHPNWRTHIFQRGGPGPPTSCSCPISYMIHERIQWLDHVSMADSQPFDALEGPLIGLCARDLPCLAWKLEQGCSSWPEMAIGWCYGIFTSTNDQISWELSNRNGGMKWAPPVISWFITRS